MNTEENAPQPDRDTETQRFDTTPAAAPAAPVPPAPVKGRSRRNVIIGVAAAVALVAVGGSAYAIGTNVGDDDDDSPSVSQDGGSSATDDRGDDDRTDDDRTDDDRDGDRAQEAGSTGITADAASMREAAEAAIAAANGTGASSIDVEHGGYEVEVLLADGSEVDVFVGADGTASIESSADDDRRADPALDLAKLGDIVDAALAASTTASGADGIVDSVSSNDDQGVAYEVSIRLTDGRDADIDLAADLALVFADVDDD